MSTEKPCSDEEIQRLLRHIKVEQKPTPMPDEPPAETKPKEATAPAVGITRELTIDEILKKMEREISGKKAIP